MKVKVCGITSMVQANELSNLDVDFIGFIFYSASKRYVYNAMQASDIKKISNSLKKVGVFVNAEANDVLKIVDDYGLHLVQLHGDESPEYCKRIGEHVTVIKAFRISEEDDIEQKINSYQNAASMFLFDAQSKQKGEEMYGGSGKKFNWQLLKDQTIKKPFFLSGGIASEDVFNLKEFNQTDVAKDLFAVDINSRFEIAPGLKDMQKVKLFVEEIKFAVNRNEK